MVEKVKSSRGQAPTDAAPLPTPGRTESPEERGKELLERLQGDRQRTDDTDGHLMAKAAKLVEKLRDAPDDDWPQDGVSTLAHLVKQIIEAKKEKLAALDRHDEFAVESAANAVRLQLRQLVQTLEPPPEIQEDEEFQGLMEMLWPPTVRRNAQHKFSRGSEMRGSVMQEVKQHLVDDALKQASQKAGEKLLKDGQQHQALNQFAKMGLDQMSRFIKRKRKRLEKGKVLNKDGELEDMTDEEKERERRELQELMELFSEKALQTMQTLKEEIVPKWAPEKQPWLLRQAAQQVFAILLATADESLLRETQAWDALQNLSKGDAVFTLRAADKLVEAASRKNNSGG